jgi:hypothetical protein
MPPVIVSSNIFSQCLSPSRRLSHFMRNQRMKDWGSGWPLSRRERDHGELSPGYNHRGPRHWPSFHQLGPNDEPSAERRTRPEPEPSLFWALNLADSAPCKCYLPVTVSSCALSLPRASAVFLVLHHLRSVIYWKTPTRTPTYIAFEPTQSRELKKVSITLMPHRLCLVKHATFLCLQNSDANG